MYSKKICFHPESAEKSKLLSNQCRLGICLNFSVIWHLWGVNWSLLVYPLLRVCSIINCDTVDNCGCNTAFSIQPVLHYKPMKIPYEVTHREIFYLYRLVCFWENPKTFMALKSRQNKEITEKTAESFSPKDLDVIIRVKTVGGICRPSSHSSLTL